MRTCYNETVDAATFEALRDRRQWAFDVPLRKRYAKFIPPQAYVVGDDICLVLEGPKVIRFRKRWSLRTVKREIRLVYIINDGAHEPSFKIHLV